MNIMLNFLVLKTLDILVNFSIKNTKHKWKWKNYSNLKEEYYIVKCEKCGQNLVYYNPNYSLKQDISRFWQSPYNYICDLYEWKKYVIKELDKQYVYCLSKDEQIIKDIIE